MGAWEEENVEMGGSIASKAEWRRGAADDGMGELRGQAALRPGSHRAGGRRKRGGSGGSIEDWR